MQVGPQENWRAGEPSREAAGGGGEDEAVREEKGWSLEVFGAQLSAQAGWEEWWEGREMAVFISQGRGPTTLLTYFPRYSTMPSFPALEKEGSGP